MERLVVISTNFRDRKFWRRWELLAENYDDIEVILLAPKEWTEGKLKQYTFGKEIQYHMDDHVSERFKVYTINMKQNALGDWTSSDIKTKIRELKPDYVYFIGHHGQLAMAQTISAAKRYASHAKRLTFTMRSDTSRKIFSKNIKHTILAAVTRMVEKYNVRNSDAIFCHYPDARKAIIAEGFKGPVFMNTQVGVDTELFHFTSAGRKAIREKYGITDEYVFGSAARFNAEKGIFDVLEALPKNEKVKYMILGSGTELEIEAIKKEIKRLDIEDKVIMPGLIPWDNLSDYLSAMDCALHVPHTTAKWKETFSLALVQAEAVGIPLIGDDSGSVPYQCGITDLLVKEGDIQKLREKMIWAVHHKEEMAKYGDIQKKYVMNSFDIRVLANHFYSVLKDLKNGIVDPKKIDTAVRG